LILGLVAWFLPWQDTLVVGDREIAGTFLSDWRGESVRFRPDATGALTESLTERLDGEGVLEVTRGEGLSGGNQLTWRPSLPVALAGVSPPRLALAFGFLLLGSLLTALRWWWLLTASGCPSRPGPVLRLSYLGVFFNLALPGLTGGDVARAGLAARENPERRAEALVSVVVDRLMGLVTLVILASIVVLSSGEDMAPLAKPVLVGAVALSLVSWLILNPGLRRLIGADRWLGRLPQGRRLLKLDRALSTVGSRHGVLAGTAVLSLLNHFCTAAAIHGLLASIGSETLATPNWWGVLGIMAVANTLSAVSLAPAGWGVGEAAYGSLFGLLGFSPTLGVATSVLYRLTAMALSLVAGLVLFLPSGRRDRKEWLREAAGPLGNPEGD
jgi:uncharacterized membrane protein YbhN (UPF0104 family)